MISNSPKSRALGEEAGVEVMVTRRGAPFTLSCMEPVRFELRSSSMEQESFPVVVRLPYQTNRVSGLDHRVMPTLSLNSGRL